MGEEFSIREKNHSSLRGIDSLGGDSTLSKKNRHFKLIYDFHLKCQGCESRSLRRDERWEPQGYGRNNFSILEIMVVEPSLHFCIPQGLLDGTSSNHGKIMGNRQKKSSSQMIPRDGS